MIFRSPLKNKPLRYPGQSLDEYIFDKLLDRLLTYALLSIIPILIITYEWLRLYIPINKPPVFSTVLFLCVSAFGIFKIITLVKIGRNYQRGSEGEKYVGHILERLRKFDFDVFHDVQGKGFNIDHVIIGPCGVFTLETKTIGKPLKGQVIARYDGQEIQLNGRALSRDPIFQAKTQARWLSNLLHERTGSRIFIQPIVVLVGWYIEGESAKHDVWVLNENRIEHHLKSLTEKFSAEQIALFSSQLKHSIQLERG